MNLVIGETLLMVIPKIEETIPKMIKMKVVMTMMKVVKVVMKAMKVVKVVMKMKMVKVTKVVKVMNQKWMIDLMIAVMMILRVIVYVTVTHKPTGVWNLFLEFYQSIQHKH